MLDDRAQAVVPAGPTADLYADIARRKIQVVVYNYELLNFEPGESHPRIVHIRRRLEKRDLLQAETYLGSLGLLLCAPGAAVAFRELVGDEESDVVAGALIGAARVSKAHDDGRLHAVPVGLFAGWFLVGSGLPRRLVGAEEAREPKAEDSVRRGLSPSPQQESLRSPLHARPPRPARRTAPRRCRRALSPRARAPSAACRLGRLPEGWG